MDTDLAEHQKKSCPFCVADLPHARHTTVLEMAQMGLRITEGESTIFEGTHAIERKPEQAA